MVSIQLWIEKETIEIPLVPIDLSSPLISLYNSFYFLFDHTLTLTQKLHEAEKILLMNKGGTFLKKLWCCVGGRE